MIREQICLHCSGNGGGVPFRGPRVTADAITGSRIAGRLAELPITVERKMLGGLGDNRRWGSQKKSGGQRQR